METRRVRKGTVIAITVCLAQLTIAHLSIAQPSSDQPPAAKPLDHEVVLRQLGDNDPRAVEKAAQTLQEFQPKNQDELSNLAEAVKSALSVTRDAAAETALRLALGKLAASGAKDSPDWALETIEWGFESMSVTHKPSTPPEVFDAHARALEMVPGAAKELMLGNLDVALNLPETDPIERQRLKEFVTLTAEKMRTRELAVFLDALLQSEGDFLAKIEAPLEERLLRCYKNVKADLPINGDALVTWLEKHPGGPVEVDLTALDVLYSVGTTQGEATTKLVERLLTDAPSAIAMAQRFKDGKLDRRLLPTAKRALEQHQRRMPSDQIQQALRSLM